MIGSGSDRLDVPSGGLVVTTSISSHSAWVPMNRDANSKEVALDGDNNSVIAVISWMTIRSMCQRVPSKDGTVMEARTDCAANEQMCDPREAVRPLLGYGPCERWGARRGRARSP